MRVRDLACQIVLAVGLLAVRAAPRWASVTIEVASLVLLGIPASGNLVEVAGITIDRISGGKFVESWDIYDASGLLRQITVLPPGATGRQRSKSAWSGRGGKDREDSLRCSP